jgi:hypothetical protein
MKCSYFMSILSVTFIVKLHKCEEYETPHHAIKPMEAISLLNKQPSPWEATKSVS